MAPPPPPPPPISSSPSAEILVHISAPSRAADDVVYRQLAEAYLAFQPDSRTRISLVDPSAEPHKQAPVPPASPNRDADVPLELASQDLSFRSAVDNRASPRLRCTPRRHHELASSQATNANTQASWEAPPSQISDSYPMPNQVMLHVSPTRVLEQYLRASGVRLPSPPSPEPCPEPSSPSDRKRPALEAGGPSPSRVDVPSSLPDSEHPKSLEIEAPGYITTLKVIPVTPLSARTEKVPQASFESTDYFIGDSILDITHIPSTAANDVSHRAGSEPPLAKRSKTTHVHGDLMRSTSDTGPMLPSSIVPSSISSSHPSLVECSNSLEMHSASPPIGIISLNPADFVSDKMAKLGKDMAHRWCPEAKRDIDPLERGYWLVDCATWSPEDRLYTWTFVCNYLRKGQAGWGTWCRRDGNHGWIRLYCWGHVAQHMYLMLYLASKRLMKKTGASWYGPDGQLALHVPPQETTT